MTLIKSHLQPCRFSGALSVSKDERSSFAFPAIDPSARLSSDYSTRRGGIATRLFIAFLVVFTILGVAGYFIWLGMTSTVQEEQPQLAEVTQSKFIHEVGDRGNVDSEGAAEVINEVESGGELTIISVLPEGSIVKKGDLLIELDSASILENVTKQQLSVNTSKASVVSAESDLETAKLTMKEYEEGKYPESLATIKNKLFSAEEAMRTAEENVQFNIRLLQRGYISETQAEAERTAFRKAENEYKAAEKEREVLVKYTHKKTIVQNNSAISSAEAKYKTALANLKLDEDRLALLQKQLDLCKIKSPQDGQVVYIDEGWREESVIKVGAKIYPRQKLIKLPDLSKMQVKAMVNEADIRLVKKGQIAKISLEAFPNQVFKGTVQRVNDFPEQGWGGNTPMAKEYEASILIQNPPPEIKPGLTAKVKIVVNEMESVLQVPTQSIFERGGKFFAIGFNDGEWAKIEVKIGPTNNSTVVIENGLAKGDKIVLGAWQYRKKVEPPIEESKESEVAAIDAGKEGEKPVSPADIKQEIAPTPAATS